MYLGSAGLTLFCFCFAGLVGRGRFFALGSIGVLEMGGSIHVIVLLCCVLENGSGMGKLRARKLGFVATGCILMILGGRLGDKLGIFEDWGGIEGKVVS